MSNPHDIANLAGPALGGIIRALSERRDQSEAEITAKAAAATNLILAFRPCDAIELLLSGQAVLFNELLADGARDTLREAVDTAKPRQRSGVVGMARVMQGHLDRLERRGNKPYRAEAAAVEGYIPVAAEPMAVTDAPRTDPKPEPVVPMPAPVVPMLVSASPEAATAGGGMPTGELMIATSWLDAPYEQWVIETPADMAAKSVVMARLERGRTAEDARIDRSDAADRRGNGKRSAVAEPALPRARSGYRADRAVAAD